MAPTPVIYEGPNVSFSGIAGNQMSGTVNFAGGLAPNFGDSDPGMAWFSLDGAPSTNFTVTLPQGVPEPTTFVLLGTGLLCLGLRKLRKQIP